MLSVLGLVGALVLGLLVGVVSANTATAATASLAAGSAVSVDDADGSFQYQGSSWTTCGGCNATASLSRFRYAYKTDDRVQIRFSGTGIRLFAFKEPPGGIGSISIDGQAATDVDFYAPTQAVTAVYTSPTLTQGSHTLTLTVTGRKSRGSSPTVNVDRAEIYSADSGTVLPPTTPPSTSVPSTPPTTAPPTTAPSTPAPTTPSTPTGSWSSGASGTGVADGSFGAWRGRPATVASTWSDTNWDNAQWSYQFNSGAEFDKWTGSIDWSPGGLWGASWSTAASGALDAQWTTMLRNVKAKWTNKQRGTFYIRFAHEMNGYWFQHSVKANEIGDFRTAWQRFYRIKQSVFPEAKLVFNTNANTNTGGGQYYDWRQLWPGDAYVDVYATDFYSQHWKLPMRDGTGAPMQLEAHRQFAAEHGKPFAVPEWGNNLDYGDQPGYIQFMYDFFAANGGTGSGNLLYECYFNVIFSNRNQFAVFPTNRTLAPQAASKYQQLF